MAQTIKGTISRYTAEEVAGKATAGHIARGAAGEVYVYPPDGSVWEFEQQEFKDCRYKWQMRNSSIKKPPFANPGLANAVRKIPHTAITPPTLATMSSPGHHDWKAAGGNKNNSLVTGQVSIQNDLCKVILLTTGSEYILTQSEVMYEGLETAKGKRADYIVFDEAESKEEVVHLFRNGSPVCKFSSLPPMYWPKGHFRTDKRSAVTCSGCLAEIGPPDEL